MLSSAYNYRFHFNFPRIVEDSKGRYETENDSGRAILHIREEALELQEAFSKDERSHALEEALDTIHAIETFLRLCYSDSEIDAMRDFVVAKNRRRNYYGKVEEQDNVNIRGLVIGDPPAEFVPARSELGVPL